MSSLIRIASGNVSAFDLLNTASYLVTNWPRQTDQSTGIDWSATQPEFGVTSEFAAGLEVGSGNFYGKVSGIIDFFLLDRDWETR